jgi:CysZ protein
MMNRDLLEDALGAAHQIFTPPFRKVLWKTIGLTLLLLGLVFAGLDAGFEKLLSGLVIFPYPWLGTAASILGGAGLVIGLAFLITPVSFVVAGFFFDELAEVVERGLPSPHGVGRALPLGEALWISLRFAAVSVVVNLVAFLLWFVPGVNAIAFFAANAYLFGRGYFELAALRYLPYPEVWRLRRVHGMRLFGAGLIMAALLAVPFVNLLTPLFGTALIVRVTQGILERRAARQARDPWAGLPRF